MNVLKPQHFRNIVELVLKGQYNKILLQKPDWTSGTVSIKEKYILSNT